MFLGPNGVWRALYRSGAMPSDGGPAASIDAVPANDAGCAPPPMAAPGVLDELGNVLASARATLSNVLDLISLEARRAGVTLVWMVVLGFVAAICLVAAWVGLMAVLALSAVTFGFPLVATVGVLAAINLLACAALIYFCINISRDLLFSATRRQLAGGPPTAKPAL